MKVRKTEPDIVRTKNRKLGRVAIVRQYDSSMFDVSFIDGNEVPVAKRRTDYNADKSIISSYIAEHAVLREFRK